MKPLSDGSSETKRFVRTLLTIFVRTIWIDFCTYSLFVAMRERVQGRFTSSKPDYISLNDLNHITMADSKVESVQTFGRKVLIGHIAFSPVWLLLGSLF